MKIRIPDKIRVTLSRKYLDWGIKFPRIGYRFIPEIKDIHEHQLRRSEEEYKKSRPPEGTEIEFLYFRLMELFHFEEFKLLRGGLNKLFPGIEGGHRETDFSTFFRRYTESISSGGIYYSLGVIYRKVRRGPLPKAFREIRKLPKEVKYINVSMHKILSSSIVVAFDVHLTKEATETLIKLQQSRYLRRLRFSSLLPWKLSGYKFSQEPIGHVKSEKILSWLREMRKGVEKTIKPYLCGYFLKQRSVNVSKLPAIEIYTLKGLPDVEEPFKIWHQEARNWWRSLGFNFFADVYGNGKFLFTWPGFDRLEGSFAYRCVVFWKSYVNLLDRNNYQNDTDGIKINTRFTLDTFLPCIELIEFYETAKRNIEKLRQNVFISMKRRSFSWFKLNNLINLNNSVMYESMLQERISMEFEERKEAIRHAMAPYDDIIKIKLNIGDSGGQYLRETLIKGVMWRITRLRKHFSVMKNSFSEYLSVRNMEALFTLQRRILLLTVIIAIATIIGLAANIDSIKNVFNSLFQFVMRIFN